MRLGAPLDRGFASPDEWIAALSAKGHNAAYAPIGPEADADTRRAYRIAAEQSDVMIAEVGAWSNPLDPNPSKAAAAFEKCCASLQLAEDLAAKCCINIAGSCNPDQWDGPHPANFDPDTFERIVETTRHIIDQVAPSRTVFCLETMPWIFPSTPEQYLDLIKAIDRAAFAVHLDPVNMVITPAIAFDTPAFLRHCFELLGPSIKSCHAKDIALATGLTVHLSECPPGTGVLDYEVFLRCVRQLNPEIPVMLEHLESEAAYDAAFAFLKSKAGDR